MPKSKLPSESPEPVAKIHWLDDVVKHDYAAAEAYLSLKLDEPAVSRALKRLRKGKVTTRRVNDILRAAGLTAAPLADPGVMKDLAKVIEGKPLSPVLVVSSDGGADIADGFHRVSLVYQFDPYQEIPLRLG